MVKLVLGRSVIAHLPLFGFSMQRTRRATAVWQWGGGHCERSEAISSSRPALSMAGDCFVAPLLAMTKGELRAVAELIAERVQGDMGDGKDADHRLRPNDERNPLDTNSRSRLQTAASRGGIARVSMRLLGTSGASQGSSMTLQ